MDAPLKSCYQLNQWLICFNILRTICQGHFLKIFFAISRVYGGPKRVEAIQRSNRWHNRSLTSIFKWQNYFRVTIGHSLDIDEFGYALDQTTSFKMMAQSAALHVLILHSSLFRCCIEQSKSIGTLDGLRSGMRQIFISDVLLWIQNRSPVFRKLFKYYLCVRSYSCYI